MKATIHHFTERGREEQTVQAANWQDAVLLTIQLLECEDHPSAAHIVFSVDHEPISVFGISKVSP